MQKIPPCPHGDTSTPRATRLADQEISAPVAHFTATFNSRERVALSLLTAASGWPALLDARRALVVLWLGRFWVHYLRTVLMPWLSHSPKT